MGLFTVIVRVQAPTNIAFTLYGPSSIPALALDTSQADTYYQVLLEDVVHFCLM
jgi:hypothetical protein